jgi:4-amino-4-deoxy-L-arabinose transferase-like glycosyltransferase
MDQTTQLRSELVPYMIGGMVGGLMLLGCGMMPLFDPLEAQHAESARELLQNLPSLIPSFNGKPIAETPPLSIWMQSAFFAVFGESELSARLSAALACGATAGLIVRIAQRLLQPVTAAFTGLAFGLCLQMQFSGRAGTSDAIGLFFATCALHFALQPVALRVALSRRNLLSLALSLGGCFLSVGFRAIASVIPICLFALASPDASSRRKRLIACGLSFAPWLGWLLFVSSKSGTSLAFLMSRHNPFDLADFSASTYIQGLPFYGATLLAGMLPFAHFIPAGIRSANAHGSEEKPNILLLLNALTPLALFTLAPEKHPSYILPSYPALMILAGVGAEARQTTTGTWFNLIKFTAVFLVLALFLTPIAVRRFSATYNLVPHLRETARAGSEAALCGSYSEPSVIWEIRKTTASYPETVSTDNLISWLKGPGVRFAVATLEAARDAGIAEPAKRAEGVSLRDGTRVRLCVLTPADIPR